MKLKIAFTISIGLLLVTNLYWAYTEIDTGVSYAYLDISYEEEKNSREILQHTIHHIVKNNNCLMNKEEIRNLYTDKGPFEKPSEDNFLVVQHLVYHFDENNCLKKVEPNRYS